MTRALVVLILVTSLVVPVEARGALISTSDALALEQPNRAGAVVDAYLARHEVATELASLGVDPDLARLRAQSLSSEELQELAGRIETAPAGGTSAITVLGVTFLVLLVLELVGITDIFKKI